MSSPSSPQQAWCFYHLQNESGESSLHPNAFRVSYTSKYVTLADVLESFPLAGSSAFHFRFQVPTGKYYMDVLHPDDRVPLVNDTVRAKVLRLDNVRCASKKTSDLPTGTPTPYFRRAGGAAAGGSRGGASAGAGRAGDAAAGGGGSGAAAAGGGGGGGSGEDENLLFADDEGEGKKEYPTPTYVDDDLKDKSPYVQAAVMWRRNELKRKQAERVAELERAAAAKAALEDCRTQAQKRHGDKLKLWAEGGTGVRKHIRTLLSTLHTVLWATSRWKEVPMSKLVEPSRVRFHFMKACRVVHPDKQNTMSGDEKFIASSVFHHLEQAFRQFEKTEMPK